MTAQQTVNKTNNYFLSNMNDGKLIKEVLIKKWDELDKSGQVFRYKLNIQKQTVLSGKFKFLIQLNPDRTQLRRLPEVIPSITPEFNTNKFNFNKVDDREVLLHINYESINVSILINNSPLTKYHSLICPSLKENFPQILNIDAIKFSVCFLQNISDRNFRIGYNSPGALASVNHLHLHLMYIEEQLYIEDVKLKHLVEHLHKLDIEYPVGFCFPITDIHKTDEICNHVIKLIEFLCKENIPHNVFITYGLFTNENILKIYIIPRDGTCLVKEFSTFNIAFCELSGYVPVGNREVYETLSERAILDKIKNDVGNIMDKIEIKVLDLFRN